MKKILLDENLPRPLVKHFSEALEMISVHDMGWAEKKNGELIRAMLDADFEFLMTADKNLQNQQNLEKYPVRLILIKTYDNRYKTLAPFAEWIEQRIMDSEEGEKIIEIDLRM